MTAATDVIADVIERRGDKTPAVQAELILKALNVLGFEVMAPQDITWGECPENWDEDLGENDVHPHEVSLELCKWCLQYGPI